VSDQATECKIRAGPTVVLLLGMNHQGPVGGQADTSDSKVTQHCTVAAWTGHCRLSSQVIGSTAATRGRQATDTLR